MRWNKEVFVFGNQLKTVRWYHILTLKQILFKDHSGFSDQTYIYILKSRSTLLTSVLEHLPKQGNKLSANSYNNKRCLLSPRNRKQFIFIPIENSEVNVWITAKIDNCVGIYWNLLFYSCSVELRDDKESSCKVLQF